MAEGDPSRKTTPSLSPLSEATSSMGSRSSVPAPGASGAESVPPRAKTEVITRLTEELAKFGAVGAVRIEGVSIVLAHPTGRRHAAVDDWLFHWEHLDEPTRRLRVSQLARTLARPTSLPVSRPPRASAASLIPWLALGALVLAIAGGLVWTVGDLGRGSPASAGQERGGVAAAAPAATAVSAPARSALVCAAARARVVRGATITVADAEGWVVDYMAFRPISADGRGGSEETPMHRAPALAAFFAAPTAEGGSAYVWPGEPGLSRMPTADDHVLVRPEVISGAAPPTHTGIRITFHGALADAYFRPETRAAYFHLASALTDALGASQAALYARCADSSSHHLGSWFRGRDHQEAVVALMYSLGIFAEPPHLADPYLRPMGQPEVDRALGFASIARVASALDRPLVASLIGREGGMVMGRPGEAVTLTFPFEDGNRASRLSREIARLTEIGGR
jgi:hypothetical protein